MLGIVLVKGRSMTPTLHNGERVLAWTPYFRRRFKRNVIVTLTNSHLQCSQHISILFAMLCSIFLMIIVVKGYGMYPVYEQGDRVLVIRRWRKQWLKTGQVLIGYPPTIPIDNSKQHINKELFIKRLKGLPNDKVVIYKSELHKAVLKNVTGHHAEIEGGFVWNVPPGYCFVKGDSPTSSDSVVWGLIPLDNIKGIIILQLPTKSKTISSSDTS